MIDLYTAPTPNGWKASVTLEELVDAAGFEAGAPRSLAWSDEYKDALRYARYRAAPEAERAPLCREMLRAQAPGHAALAARCLVALGHESDVAEHLEFAAEPPLRVALLKSELRKSGRRVVERDGALRVEPAR